MTASRLQPPSKHGHRIWGLIKILLALILAGFIVSKTDLRQLTSLSGQIVWFWLALRFTFFCLMIVSKSFQYWILLDREIPYSRMLGIVVLQNALSNFVANSAGIASYLTMLNADAGVKLRRAGGAFIVTKAGDLFAMWLFLLISSFFVWGEIEDIHGLIVLLAAGVLFGLIMFLTTVLLRQRFVSALRRAASWFRIDHLGPVNRALDTLQALASQETGMVFTLFLRGSGLSLLYMCITLSLYYSSMRVFSIPIDFWPIIFVAAILQLLSIVPIQVLGGLGVTEVTSMYLYGLFGVTQDVIAAPLLGLRMIYYLMNLATLLYLPVETFLLRQKTDAEHGKG